MNLEDVDPSIVIKKNQASMLRFYDGNPLFNIIELNLIGACNRKCNFCPVSDDKFYKKNKLNGRLRSDLYSKLIDELSEIKYEGLLLYSGYSEPLLHNKIVEYVELARKKLPKCDIELNTNGDLLSVDMINDLHDAGLTRVKVSLYDGEHQVQLLNRRSDESVADESFLILRRRYYEGGDYGVIFSNRGGAIDISEYNGFNLNKADNTPCYYPFYMMNIDLNGDVQMCSQDWRKQYLLGNLYKERLIGIWQGVRLQKIRKMIAKYGRQCAPCCECDVKGTLMGGDVYRE